MAELFRGDQSVVSRHTKNVFEEGELDERTNMQRMHTSPWGPIPPRRIWWCDSSLICWV